MSRFLFPVLTCIPLLVACGSNEDGPEPGTGGSSSENPASSSGGTDGSGGPGTGGMDSTGGADGSGGKSGFEACPHDPYPEPNADEEQFFEKLTAKLVEGGDVAVVRAIQVCSFDVCLVNFTTSDDGVIEFVNLPEDGMDPTKILVPAFKTGDGIGHATLAYRLPTEPEHELGDVEVISLPSFEDGQPLTSGGDSSSAGVTLSLADDTALKFDRLTYPKEEEQTFRAAVRTGFNHPSFADDALVVAMAPEGTDICPAADLTVPNSTGWPSGSKVLMRKHGTKLTQEYAPYTGFGEDVEGTVSDDGESIVFEDAVNGLGVVEIRLAE